MDRFMDDVTSAVYKIYRNSCSILFKCIHIGTIQDIHINISFIYNNAQTITKFLRVGRFYST